MLIVLPIMFHGIIAFGNFSSSLTFAEKPQRKDQHRLAAAVPVLLRLFLLPSRI